jgi:glycine cleavage system aminomethyltransferase T
MDALITSIHNFLFFFSVTESKSLAIAYLKTARHNKKQTNQIEIARKMLPA